MFSLIVTIISIALVAALALATLYYGGAAFTSGQLDAQLARIDNQSQQLTGAAQLYKANTGAWPQTLQALVASKYLKAIPTAQAEAVSAALADGGAWTMPVEYVPVFVLDGISPELCRGVNERSYGARGILSVMPTSLTKQCSGPNLAQLSVVVATTGESLEAAAASGLPNFGVADLVTSAPSALVASNDAWMVDPTADAVAPTANVAVQQLTAVAGTTFDPVSTGHSTQLSFTLKNTSAGSLEGIQLATGGDSALSVQPGTCGPTAVLGYQESCTFTVQYAPSLVQSLAGSVTVSSSAVNSSTTLALTGASTGIGALVFTHPFAFGAVNLGDTTATMTVPLTNTGTAAVTGVQLAGAAGSQSLFSVESNCGDLAIGASCNVTVGFSPAQTASTIHALTATAEGVTGGTAMSGSGAQMSASTSMVANGSAGTVSLNNVLGSVGIASVKLYSGAAEVATSTSVANGSGSAVAQFATIPTAGSLTFTAFDAGGYARGTGTLNVYSALVSQFAGTGDFGAIALGESSTRTITFKSTGTTGLTNVSVSTTGNSAYAITGANTCGTAGSPVSLALNGTCNVTVSFSPSADGAATGAVVFNSNASNSPFSVNLTGSGVAAQAFGFTGSVATYSVPTTGAYAVTVVGASGSLKNNLGPGGRGAEITCTLNLTAGEQLKVLVGGKAGYGSYSGAGGGASAVYTASNTPLCIAGGGGGGASSVTSMSSGTSADARGVVGGTGVGAASAGGATGGGGFFSKGADANATNFGGSSIVSGGAKVEPNLNHNGNTSGTTLNSNLGYGGFGGGSPGTSGGGQPGSGGGYNGGAYLSPYGNGGSSFSATASPVVVLGQHVGDGSITFLPQ